MADSSSYWRILSGSERLDWLVHRSKQIVFQAQHLDVQTVALQFRQVEDLFRAFHQRLVGRNARQPTAENKARIIAVRATHLIQPRSGWSSPPCIPSRIVS